MALSQVVIKSAPTSYTVTGGTIVPFTVLKNTGNETVLAATADTDVRIRRTIQHSIADPAPSAKGPNGFTQQKQRTLISAPKVLANTKITVNSFLGSLSWDVEATPAEKIWLLDQIVQYYSDTNVRAAILAGTAS